MDTTERQTLLLHTLVPTGFQPRPVAQHPGLGLPQRHVAARGCQRKVAAVPHAGGAGGRAGARAEGALLPQAQHPPTGEAQARWGGCWSRVGAWRWGAWGSDSAKAAVGRGACGGSCWGRGAISSCCVWRDPHWAPPPPQDVDSRDRRRRELGPPESQQPREQPEPSTSWWPVSSAEKKKNFTLVRAGPTRSGRDSGRGRWHDRCGGKGSAWSFRVRAACDEG